MSKLDPGEPHGRAEGEIKGVATEEGEREKGEGSGKKKLKNGEWFRLMERGKAGLGRQGGRDRSGEWANKGK